MNDDLSFVLSVLGFFIGVMFIIAIPCIGLEYISSCKEARIYNAQNQTDYTCGDFFWAQDQINSQSQTIKLK